MPKMSLPMFYLLHVYCNKVIPTVLPILISNTHVESNTYPAYTAGGRGAKFFQIHPTGTLVFYPSTAVHLTPISDSVKGVGTITDLHDLGRGADQYSAHRSC